MFVVTVGPRAAVAPLAPVLDVVDVVPVLGLVPVAPVLEVAPVAVVPDVAPLAPVGAVVVGVTVTAGIVTVVVAGPAFALEFPASDTSEAASTPSASSATAATPITGAVQRGDAASRVRAAPPQRRHQSCSGASGAPHSGQASAAWAGSGWPAAAEGSALSPVEWGVPPRALPSAPVAAALTCPPPAGG